MRLFQRIKRLTLNYFALLASQLFFICLLLANTLSSHASESPKIELTESEIAWLKEHPVIRVQNESDSIPYNFNDGKPNGYSIDYMNLLASKLGIKFEFVSGHTWDEFLTMIRNKELDVMVNIVDTPSRRKFILFTRDYQHLLEGIYIKIGKWQPRTLAELNHKKLALVEGFYQQELLQKFYPDIQLHLVDSNLSAIESVLVGESDATISDTGLFSYMAKKHSINGLQLSGIIKDERIKNSLSLAVRDDWPELRGILQKAIDSVSSSEQLTMTRKWLPDTLISETSDSPQYNSDSTKQSNPLSEVIAWPNILIIVVLIVLASLSVLFLFKLLDRSKKDPLAYQFSSSSGKKIALFFNIILIFTAVSLSTWELHNIKIQIKNDLKDSLQTVLKTTHETLKIWIKDQINQLKFITNEESFVTLVQKINLSEAPSDERENAIHALQGFIADKTHLFDSSEFYLISAKGINLAAQDQSLIGQMNTIQFFRPEKLQQVFGGEGVFIPPIPSTKEFIDDTNSFSTKDHPIMFFAVPISNELGQIIAAFAMRYEPQGTFSQINQLARLGNSGETYSFDSGGKLLSSSRFEDQLAELGLIVTNESSILSIQIRDPGGNLLNGFKARTDVSQLPLTHMALSATQGQTGIDLTGYRDYRGVPVFGAWLWDKELNFGLTTEIDVDEALEAYFEARQAIVIILGITISISITFTIMSLVLGSRANRALKHARDELEERVHERTAELELSLTQQAESEQRLQTVIDHVPAIVLFKDEFGRYELINNLFESVFKIERQNVLGKTDKELFKSEQALAVSRKDQQVLASCQPDQFEERIRHADRSFHDYIMTKVPLVNSESKEKHLLGVALDITERKQIEIQLRQALFDIDEQKFVLDQHAIVAVTDLKGNITHANKRFAEISGYEIDELIGKNHRILNSGTHQRTFWKKMYKTVAEGGVWHEEVCNRAKDGSLYWVDTTIAAFKGDDGKPRAYVAIRTDISDRKRYEKELQTAIDVAEAANAAKSQFLAAMSHEIRTPMNGVLGMLGLLNKSELSHEQKRKIEIAQKSANALLTLINDILDFSKIEAGKLELEELDFDLRSLFEDIAQSMAFRCDEKGLELLLNISKIEQSKVIGDSSRLRQVIINLVGNAIKFTESGEILIRADLRKVNDDELILTCQVKDTGIGIPVERIDKLFESFTQVDASTTRKFGGTGLGLAICKNICVLMGGDISVNSTPEQGSTFEFFIKLMPSLKAVKVMPRVDISQLKILVVDDNPTNREIFRCQLESWGAKVWEADSAQKAILSCLEHTDALFDIALVDMSMPEMDGETFGRYIRQQPQFEGMKLVMMTSIPKHNDLAQLAKIGFNGFFSKPMTTSDLFDALSVVAGEVPDPKEDAHLVTQNYLSSFEHTSDKESTELIRSWPKQVRLLVVEDNQINQYVIQSILKEYSLTCDCAGNGLEAIAALNSSPEDAPYTLIFMDCQMPELDGYETTRQIRSGKAGRKYQAIPVIAMTANALSGDKEKCLESGMNDYLSKPLDSDELLQVLKNWFMDSSHLKSASDTIDSSEIRNLPEIKKLSIPSGLQAFDFEHNAPAIFSNPQLFLKAISSFYQQYEQFDVELKQAVKSNEQAMLHNLAHKLKGAGGNLGLFKLYRQTIEFEQQLKDKRNISSTEVDPLLDFMAHSLNDIRLILTANQPTPSKRTERAFDDVKRQLLTLLDKNAFIEQNLIDEFCISAKNTIPEKEITTILKGLESFDYHLVKASLTRQE